MNIKKKIPQKSYSGMMWRTNRANKIRLIEDFDHKCAYCDDLDKYGGGSKSYHVEHFAPKEKFPELEYDYDNLLYSCPYCNISKSNKWPSDNSIENIKDNRGFINPCTSEYNTHLTRRDNGEIYYKTLIGKYMYYELKLYLERHQLIYNLERIHIKLKEVKEEISKREKLHKSVTELKELYRELSVIFFEYYDIFSEENK